MSYCFNTVTATTLTANTISEKTSGSGVTIDSGLLKVDTINEKTSGSGVIIDSVVLKDNTVTATTLTADTINEKTSATGVTIDSVVLKDGNINANDASFNNLILSANGKIAINMETGTSLESRPKLATFSINETENRTYEDVGKFVASFRPNSSSTGANLLLRGNSKQVSSEYKSEAGLYFGTPYTTQDKNNCAIIAEHVLNSNVGLSKLHICTGYRNDQIATYEEASLNNSKLTIDYSGNVSIGDTTTSNNYRLDVKGSIRAGDDIYLGFNIRSKYDTTGTYFGFPAAGGGKTITFVTDDVEAMRIENGVVKFPKTGGRGYYSDAMKRQMCYLKDMSFLMGEVYANESSSSVYTRYTNSKSNTNCR